MIPPGVTSIGISAFRECYSLVSVTIPEGVSAIEASTFSGCWNLLTINLPDGLFRIGASAFSECWRLTDIRIPTSVEIIESGAFSDCSSLRQVTIPKKVSFISTHAFQFCTNLSEVVFQGDAPAMGANVFLGAKSDLTIYYYEESNGFTSPLWCNLPAVNLGARNLFLLWFQNYDIPEETNVLSDLNNDGVSLLMAYALGLDPRLNLSGSMPKPVLSEGLLEFTFFAGSEGVIYAVETSDDLLTWTASGVSIGPQDQFNRRTASVPTSGARKFLRLVVSSDT